MNRITIIEFSSTMNNFIKNAGKRNKMTKNQQITDDKT